MAANATRPGRSRIVAEINITPLTDVFLVLLIIFMVTTSIMMDAIADIDLPAAAETTTDTRGVTVTMTSEREVYVGDRRVPGGDGPALVSALRDALRHSTDKVVILAGDQSIVLGEVVRVLALSKEAGADGFALAAD
jgi:biopolymer transport protein ExbD